MVENEQESLELDKLEASAVAKRDNESPESLENGGEGESPAPKPLDVGHRNVGVFKDKGFLLSCIAGLIVAAAAFYQFSHHHPAQDIERENGFLGRITHVISAPIGFKYHVRFRLLVPFKDLDEKRILIEKLSGIRPELMRLSQNPDVVRVLREKDMVALKAQILTIAAKVISVPLTELGLTDLSVD